jgi:hypothetical protein
VLETPQHVATAASGVRSEIIAERFLWPPDARPTDDSDGVTWVQEQLSQGSNNSIQFIETAQQVAKGRPHLHCDLAAPAFLLA